MKTLLLLVLLLLSTKQKEVDYYMVYANNYSSNFSKRNIVVVLVFKQDSVRTYIEDYGYVWWKVDKADNVKVYPDKNILLSGDFNLTRNRHTSKLMVHNTRILQLIHLDGDPPIVFSIELKRKQITK